MGEGVDQASLAGSLPPLARASAPDSWATLMEDFIAHKKNFLRGDGRRSRPVSLGWQSSTLGQDLCP